MEFKPRFVSDLILKTGLDPSPCFIFAHFDLNIRLILREAAKKVLYIGGVKGLATKEKRTFFEALKKIPQKNPSKKCGY